MTQRPYIAACLIVKNELEWIADAIASVRSYVSEICIFDTGSTDGTLELLDELAAEPGAPIRVERGEWRNDFGWARNQSFAMASPETHWILWLDADDVACGAENLAVYLASLEPSVDCVRAALYHTNRIGPQATVEQCMVYPIRLMRAGAGEWHCVLDEGWGSYSSEEQSPVIPSELFWVYHADRYMIPGKYIDLAAEATKDLERTPHAYFILARELWHGKRYSEAMSAIDTFLTERHDVLCTGTEWNGWRPKGYALKHTLHAELGELEQAEQAEAEIRRYLETWISEAKQGRAPDLESDWSDGARPGPALAAAALGLMS